MAAGHEFFMDLELAAAMERAAVGNYFNLASSALGGGVAGQFFPNNSAAQPDAGSATHGGPGAMAPATFGFGGALPVAVVAAPAPPLPAAPGAGADAEDVEQLKGTWTQEEDSLLRAAVNQFGERKWAVIAKYLPGRIGKQCRERWINHLHPDIKKDAWTEAEDLELVDAHKTCGNKWSVIARRLPGRSENSVKNHWNATRRGLNARRVLKKRSSQRQPAPGRLSYLAHYISTIHPPPPSAAAASLSPPPPPVQENEEQQLHAPQDAVEEQDPAAGNGENGGSATEVLGDEFYYFTHMQVPQQQQQQQVQQRQMNYNMSYNVYPPLTAEDFQIQMGLNRMYAEQQAAQDRGSSSNNARLDRALMGNNAVGGGGFSSYAYGGGVGPSGVAGQEVQDEVNVAQFAAEPGQYQVFNLEDLLTRFPSI